MGGLWRCERVIDQKDTVVILCQCRQIIGEEAVVAFTVKSLLHCLGGGGLCVCLERLYSWRGACGEAERGYSQISDLVDFKSI